GRVGRVKPQLALGRRQRHPGRQERDAGSGRIRRGWQNRRNHHGSHPENERNKKGPPSATQCGAPSETGNSKSLTMSSQFQGVIRRSIQRGLFPAGVHFRNTGRSRSTTELSTRASTGAAEEEGSAPWACPGP